jgi:cell division protein FtsI (penicillin-binding protein 3)
VSQKHQASYLAWRFYFILIFIACTALILAFRVFDLAILDQPFLKKQGDQRALRLVSTPAFRGMIVDRNGYPLAVSTSVYSIWANPKEFNATNDELRSLANQLGMKPKEVSSLIKMSAKKSREFVYLKRGMSPEIANKIKALEIDGVYSQEEYRRYYPEGEVAAHVIGFTNVDDHGQEGIELAYNEWLEGAQGKKWVVKDRLGRTISDIQAVQDKKSGQDLMLTIDRRIQYLAYRELAAGVLENKAASGTVIVLDVKTGQILAMVNQPSFNPNNRPAKMNDVYRNRAVTDTFEPGSTIKTFSIATALTSGKFAPTTMINTNPGWLHVGHNIVKDHKNNGEISVSQVLELSSNVGVTRMILTLPQNALWNTLNKVGFGEATYIGFPGEQAGSLTKQNPWSDFALATLSFGYGMSVTPLQLAQAYLVIANNGIKIPVSLIMQNKPITGERVISESVAKKMLAMLETVVLSKVTTAKNAAVPGYHVGGKTGTALLAGDGGYQKHRYTSSFVGIAPLSNPRFVVAVIIHDPQGKKYYGADVAAPIFQKVMEGTLRIYDVPPDQLSS